MSTDGQKLKLGSPPRHGCPPEVFRTALKTYTPLKKNQNIQMKRVKRKEKLYDVANLFNPNFNGLLDVIKYVQKLLLFIKKQKIRIKKLKLKIKKTVSKSSSIISKFTNAVIILDIPVQT